MEALSNWTASAKVLAMAVAVLVIAVVAIVAADRVYFSPRLAVAQSEAERAQDQAKQWRSSFTAMSETLGRQNGAVAAWAATAAKRQAAADDALRAAEVRASTAMQKIDVLNQRIADESAKGKTCEDAFEEWRAGM
ncbi:hypothetical protein [Pandoraea commovens]|uniref:Uncharacterized protein n=1 Tax=Pandoraea commovens TaxID=2508289 RepID=A0ABY5QJ88_9BURK|nr:hypothetical protein [Pandoraea commovens]UVA80482.1 hypothetical protein NTU39_05515 [Pandoraea commovens]